MDKATPQKGKSIRDVLQVPSSLPILSNSNNINSIKNNNNSNGNERSISNSSRDATNDRGDKHKCEMRKRFYAHKFWPIISKRFYYLSDPELFKAMVKGKGNLRDISQWLAENISLNERLQQYDAKQQAKRESEDKKRSRTCPGESEREKFGPSPDNGIVKSGSHNHQTTTKKEPPLPPSESYAYDEDASPVKGAGKARQKRHILNVEPKMAVAAPDTKVHLLKPKVSILEKYRNRQQPRIDHLLAKGHDGGDTPKKRRLVRADKAGEEEKDDDNLVIKDLPVGVSQYLLKKYGYQEDETVLNLKHRKPSEVVNVDELDMLEEKIQANIPKTIISVENDGHLDEVEELFSDDMSAEDIDDDDRYGSGMTSIDPQILEFLNQASVQELCEICNVTPKTAAVVVSRRPFRSVYAIAEDAFDEAEAQTKRKTPRKLLGMKIVEHTEFSLKGYRAVDSLVRKCSEYGRVISQQMALWGVKATGEGELDMVQVTGVPEAEGREGSDDGIAGARRELPYLKHKPTLLAPEVVLKPYQQVGVNWLHLLYHNKLSCILADEMGLGKTCQVIAFMAHLKALLQLETDSKTRPHLVVVPSLTLENWLREFHKFCPDLAVQAYYGLQAEREDLRYEMAESGAEYDVLVTTYNLATGAAADFKFLRSQNFDMIVYDEGHMLKNSTSDRHAKLMRLKAGFRLLLTGTPLQNNLKELVSLLAFMLPGLFVEKRDDLQGLFNKTAMLNNSSKDYNPLLSQQAIAKAKTMMTPFVLRRKKAQVLQYLPEKSHQIIKCAMSPTQKEIYDELIAQGKKEKMERERRKLLVGKEVQDARLAPVQSSTNVMMTLRKAAMHPLLFRRLYTDEKLHEMSKRIMEEPQYIDANRAFIIEDMQVMSDCELNALCEKFPRSLGGYVLEELKWLDSGKVAKFLEIVRCVILRLEKMLAFSLFTQMLDILEKILSFANITFVRLDGLTAVDTRQDIIDRFHEDSSIPVFLLSTKAGGFGINLVAANNVVIFDQSFNPHDDKQAEDRAHRVGQTQEVRVTKLILEHTIDENILILAENKLQLDQFISIDPGETKFEENAALMFEKILFDK